MGAYNDLWDKGTDIGGGVRISRLNAGENKEWAGVFIMHRHADEALCVGSVRFDLPVNASYDGAKWQVVSLDPLHVEPSILQRECGLHGFIRNGRWENA